MPDTNEQLKSIIARIEKLTEDKQSIQEYIKDIYAEAKSNGYEPRIIRKIVRLRSKAKSEIQEESELTSLYLSSINDPIAEVV